MKSGQGPPSPHVQLERGRIHRGLRNFAIAITISRAISAAHARCPAVRALTGASFPKFLIYAITPQIMPRYLGVSIYRLDANIRHSTVVGIVGAGGIGQVLQASFNRYDYDFSLAILLAIVALVFIGEFFSAWIRGKLR